MGRNSHNHPFSDLSETDLADYERHIRSMRSLAEVMREAERFTKPEAERKENSDTSKADGSQVNGANTHLVDGIPVEKSATAGKR